MTRARDLAAFVSNADGDIKFDTDTLFIDSSANQVGIGTTTPNDELDVEGADPAIRLTDTSASGYARVFANNGSLLLQSDEGGSVNNSIIGFDVDGTERMRIDSNGNVGIGTSAPVRNFHLHEATSSTPVVFAMSTDGTGATTGDGFNISIDGSSGAVNLIQRENAAMQFYTNGGTNERMRITSDGPIGTGSIAANNINNSIAFTSTGNGTHADHFYSFGPHYTSDDPAYYVINHSSVGVYMSYGGNSWQAHSDERIKENIISLGTVLPNIENLRCVKYNLKGQSETKIGFIAQDWETNFSEVVDESSRQVIEDDGTLSMDSDSESTTTVKAMSYTETIPVLLKAIQEQQEEIKTLKTKVAALEAE
jgi:hypothetical protein